MDSGRDCITSTDMDKLLILGQSYSEFVITVIHGCQDLGVGTVKEDILHC